MNRTIRAIIVAALLALSQVGLADVYPLHDIHIWIKCPCKTPPRSVPVGEMDVEMKPGTGNCAGRTTMEATFTVDPTFNGQCPQGCGGVGGACQCVDFHFFQIITYDDCPAKVGGVAPPRPVVDTPPFGWDYMYNDLDVPKDGIQMDERVPENAKGGFDDDARDTLPWYHTPEEEAAQFDPCVTYKMSDCPGPCTDPPGRTEFTTWLVAVAKCTCANDPQCLKPGEFILLAGFDWAIPDVGITITTRTAADAATALANAGFAGWTPVDTGVICCPEPVGLTLLVLGAGLLLRRRRS